jgi:D-alanyl-D-alanine carboxypeptidase
VLTLVEEGAVELDRPASDYVERLPLPDGVTVRHLLSHRSGLADHTQAAIYGDEEQGESRAWSPEELYGFVSEQAPVFEPGTGFEYGNVGYLVAAVLVEEVTSQPYHQVLRERILEPLGLESTYLSHFEDGLESVAGFAGAGSGQVWPADFDFTAIDTTLWSAGGMVSTAADLHRFATALADGEVVDQSLVHEMLTPVGTADGVRRHPAVPHEYGLGVALFDTPETVFGAFGNVPGYHALLLHAPDRDRTVVYSSSNELFAPPTGRLLELLLDDTG